MSVLTVWVKMPEGLRQGPHFLFTLLRTQEEKAVGTAHKRYNYKTHRHLSSLSTLRRRLHQSRRNINQLTEGKNVNGK